MVLQSFKVFGGSGRRPRFPVRKAVGRISARTALHGDFLLVCEFDPRVGSISDAREAVPLPGSVLHVPDYRIVMNGRPVLVDILVSDRRLDRERLEAVQRAAAARCLRYRIETNETICAEPRYTTAVLINSCRRRRVSPDDRVKILHALAEAGPLTLAEVAALASGSLEAVSSILSLVCEGLLEIDISNGLIPEAAVRRRSPIPTE